MNPFDLSAAPAASAAAVVLLTMLVVATVTDLRRRRIPNIVTLPAALAAFIVHAAYGGVWGLACSLLAFLGWFVLGFLFYRMAAGRQIGGGDIKMVMATAACIGAMPAARLTFVSLVLVLLWLFLRWTAQRTLGANLVGLRAWLAATLTPGVEKVHFRPVGMVDRTPHAPFMLAAALLVYCLHRNGISLPL